MKLFYLKGDIAYTDERGAIHRVFCIDEGGNNLLLAVTGFKTWIDIEVPHKLIDRNNFEVRELFGDVVDMLNEKLRTMMSNPRHPSRTWLIQPSSRHSEDQIINKNELSVNVQHTLMGYS